MRASLLTRWASREVRFLAASAGLLVAGWAFLTIGPAVEEKYFPIMAGVVEEHHSLEADGWQGFQFRFHKLRDCRSLSSDWFYVDPNGRIGIADFRAAQYSHHPVGEGLSPDLEIRMPKTAKQFYGIVTYDCGWPWFSHLMLGPFPNWSAL